MDSENIEKLKKLKEMLENGSTDEDSSRDD